MMTAKRRNLFLYLTLVCFLGIVAIFIADGYMGVYDTLYITGGEWEEKVEADRWTQTDRYWSAGVSWGAGIGFEYEVDNRLFRNYSAEVSVSIWQSQRKVTDLLAQTIELAPFKKGRLEWLVDTKELEPEGLLEGQGAQYTVIIKRGEIERKIIVNINPSFYPPKVPIPVR